MSGKRIWSGLVVVGAVVGMLAGEAIALQRGRGAARGRSAPRRAPAASHALPTPPSVPGMSHAISSPIRSGAPTLAPSEHGFSRRTGNNMVSSPSDRPQFRDRTKPQTRPENAWDRSDINGPIQTTLSGAYGSGNLTASPYQPFTPAWYAEHPKAWQMTHPHADAAVLASTTAVAAWLGNTATSAYASSTTTVITSENAPQPAPEAVPEAAPVAASDTPVTGGEEWLPLGSFTLMLDGQTTATRAIQLAVNRHGVIRGTYYDMAADSVKEVIGTVDPQTLRARWTIGESGLVVYEIPIASLDSPEGNLTVRYANGQTATWHTKPMVGEFLPR